MMKGSTVDFDTVNGDHRKVAFGEWKPPKIRLLSSPVSSVELLGYSESKCSSRGSSSRYSSTTREEFSSFESKVDLCASSNSLPLSGCTNCSSSGCSSASSDFSSSLECSSSSDCSSDFSWDGDLVSDLTQFLSEGSHPARKVESPSSFKNGSTTKRPIKDVTKPEADCGIDLSDSERLALIREDLQKVGRMFTSQQCADIRERAYVLAEINHLSRHVPSSVLDHLGREIRNGYTELSHFRASPPSKATADTEPESVTDSSEEGDWDCISSFSYKSLSSLPCLENRESFYSASFQDGVILGLPYVAPFHGAVLFVDIAGFTALSARVGSENISQLLNKYFDALINEIFNFHGDIQKFSGDAFFAEWRVTATRTIDDCAKLAAFCTCKLAQDLQNFSVEVQNGTVAEVVEMNCHFGLGIGAMTGIHVGDSQFRRQYLHVGDPISQATAACHLAGSGDVVVSPEFHNIVSTQNLNTVIAFERTNDAILMKISSDELDEYTHNAKVSKKKSLSRAITHHVEGLELDSLKEYQRLISLYCHPVERASHNSAKDLSAVHNHQEKAQSDASEMRNVFVAFLNAPMPSARASDAILVDSNTVHKINRVFNLVSRELLHYNGYLESFIDDKGFSLMITFGLRGSWFPDLVSAVALPAVMTIWEVLLSEEDIRCHIGATYGNVRCGFLGSSLRHEYTVLGPSVNLAARLMTAESNNGLLVDQSVRDRCEGTHFFEPNGYISAKGYSGKIMTYMPIAQDFVDNWRHPIRHCFVGRQKELDFVVSKALKRPPDSMVVLIEGASGLGKSALLSKSSSILFEKLSENNRVRLEFIVGDPRMSTIPFWALHGFIKSILRLLNESIYLEQVMHAEILRALEALVDSAESHSNENDLVGLSGRVCRLLTLSLKNVDRLIISIKDCHRLDAFSWRTLGMLLEANDGIFLVGTTSTRAEGGFRMDEETGSLFFDSMLRSARLSILELDSLTIEDIRTMLLELLNVDSIEDDVLNSVYAESGGRPLFVAKIVERLKSPEKAAFCEDLIVDQLDRLSYDQRRCLAVASCFGAGFTSDDVRHILKLQDNDYTEFCSSALHERSKKNIES